MEWVTCRGGILDGQWFTAEEWADRTRAHQRMRDKKQYRSRGALDYTPTMETAPHPTEPFTGTVHDYKWK